MQVYRLPKAAGIDCLELQQADMPRPARGQVLVRMRAASLNYRDLMVAKGTYARGRVPPNLVPVSDGAGEVVELGPDATRVRVGDRVAGIFMQSWIAGEASDADAASALGGSIDGVLAEYVLFEQQGLVQLPEHLSFEEGATLPCAAITAWNALFAGPPLTAGETVLALGTGGVSIFALQFAVIAGARVIATSSSDEKLRQARQLGAELGVNYRQTPEWQDAVLEATGGRGVDHTIEVGGSGTLQRSIAATRRGGEVALIGVLTGRNEINPMGIMTRGVSVRGIYVGSRAMFEAMNRALYVQRLHPVIDRVFPFAEAKAAYRHLESQQHFGKVVIRIP
jgi:NADPH:quinone reductase-like Zn-dependent oxidoreductase